MIQAQTINLNVIDLRHASTNDIILSQYKTAQSRINVLSDVFEACEKFPKQIKALVSQGRITIEIYCEKAKAFDTYLVNIEGNWGHHVSWIKGFLMFKRKMNIE